jgi:hypothetical protein
MFNSHRSAVPPRARIPRGFSGACPQFGRVYPSPDVRKSFWC